MPYPCAKSLLPLLALACLGTPSCTVTKPLVCAVSTPIQALGHGSLHIRGDGRAAFCVLAAFSAVGAAGGLVTGIVSDIQILCGATDDPTRNIACAFAIN